MARSIPGKRHGRALKVVARKRLRAIYAVMRDRMPYREWPRRLTKL